LLILGSVGILFGIPLVWPRNAAPRQRFLGFAVMLLGALAGFLLDRWAARNCYEADQPCEGEVINWAPWVVVLAFLGVMVLSLVVIVSRVWREFRGPNG
jgi:hypothetical protein